MLMVVYTLRRTGFVARAAEVNEASRSAPLGDEARQLIAIRLDPRVLATLRKEAKRRGVDYQTLINEVLARHAKREVA